jgi:cytochrome c-type biogenesis protein CcmH/NrfG
VPRESVIFGIAGVFFGILVGWIIGSQQIGPARQVPAAPADAQRTQSQQARTPPPLDEARVARLKAALEKNPGDAATRVELGNLYFDHERFVDAAHWYEEALKLEPRNVNVSTDLGIAYYYMNRPDIALAQFDRSLEIEPGHTKTLLNIGIVRAFAKQDLDGAAKVWQRVIELAPASPEAGAARQALASLRSAHPDTVGAQQSPADKPK